MVLQYTLKGSEQLRWIHNKDVIFDRRGDKLNKGRLDDVERNGSLRLRNMDETKAGKYAPLVYEDGEEKGNLKPIRLCVIGRLHISPDFSYVV